MENNYDTQVEKMDDEDDSEDKPGLAWIDAVLGEMKSEFNKQLFISDNEEDCDQKPEKKNASGTSTRKRNASESPKDPKKDRKRPSFCVKSNAHKSSRGKPSPGKPSPGKTSAGKLTPGKPSPGRSSIAKPSSGKSPPVKCAAVKSDAVKSTAVKSAAGKCAPGKLSSEKLPLEKLSSEKSSEKYTSEKSSAAKPSPGKSSPGKSPPGKSSQGKSSQGKCYPAKSSPGKSSPGKSSPGMSSRGKSFFRKSTLERRSPGKSSPGKSSPGKSSPGKSSPGKSSPGKSSPGKSSPGKSSTGKCSPGKSSPGKCSPGKSSPGKCSPGKSSPGKSSPGKPTPGKFSPRKLSPRKLSPRKLSTRRPSTGKPSPGKSSPGKPSSVKSSPGRSIHSKPNTAKVDAKSPVRRALFTKPVPTKQLPEKSVTSSTVSDETSKHTTSNKLSRPMETVGTRKLKAKLPVKATTDSCSTQLASSKSGSHSKETVNVLKKTEIGINETASSVTKEKVSKALSEKSNSTFSATTSFNVVPKVTSQGTTSNELTNTKHSAACSITSTSKKNSKLKTVSTLSTRSTSETTVVNCSVSNTLTSTDSVINTTTCSATNTFASSSIISDTARSSAKSGVCSITPSTFRSPPPTVSTPETLCNITNVAPICVTSSASIAANSVKHVAPFSVTPSPSNSIISSVSGPVGLSPVPDNSDCVTFSAPVTTNNRNATSVLSKTDAANDSPTTNNTVTPVNATALQVRPCSVKVAGLSLLPKTMTTSKVCKAATKATPSSAAGAVSAITTATVVTVSPSTISSVPVTIATTLTTRTSNLNTSSVPTIRKMSVAPTTTKAANATSSETHIGKSKRKFSRKAGSKSLTTIPSVRNSAAAVKKKRATANYKSGSLRRVSSLRTRKMMKRKRCGKPIRKTTKTFDKSESLDKVSTDVICESTLSAACKLTNSQNSGSLHVSVEKQDLLEAEIENAIEEVKLASFASSLPYSSESIEMIECSSDISLLSDLEDNISLCSSLEELPQDMPNIESPAVIETRADPVNSVDVAPLTSSLLAQASENFDNGVYSEVPHLVNEDMFENSSDESDELSLLDKIEKVASDAEDDAPRLLITLKPGNSKDDSILSLKGCREVIGSEGVWSVANVETIDDKYEKPLKNDKPPVQTKTVEKPQPEVVALKRSARRKSRDCHRETVLQSAIARKEKSFSIVGQSSTKNAKSSTARSSRQNVKTASGKRSAADPKKSAAKVVKPTKKKLANGQPTSKVKKSDIQTKKITRSQSCSNYGETTVARNKFTVETAAMKSHYNMNLSGQAYTKTGKRRYKPYKGLRYSFTGSSVKKSKLARQQRRISETSKFSDDLESRPMVARKSDKLQTHVEFPRASEKIHYLRKQPSSATHPVKDTHFEELCVIESDSESDSESSLIEEITIPRKRKLSLEEIEKCFYEEYQRKRYCYEKNTHSLARRKPQFSQENLVELRGDYTSQHRLNVAEPLTKVTNDRPVQCCCQKATSLFAAPESPDTTLTHCQGMDSIDKHVIGCTELVNVETNCLRRVSVRCPFVVLCEVHKQRLLRHMCCPGCGLFCTQGSFVMCSSKHLYHRVCEMVKGGLRCCPHCGERSPSDDCMLILSTLKTPIYLPELIPIRKDPTARITVKESNRNSLIDEREKSMTLPLDKEKLTQLVNTACSMQVVSDHEINTSRSMEETLFIAAKTGNAEKILQALASGIDANHPYEEANMGSALHVAANEGNLAAVHILLQSGAQVDLMDNEQNTPLILAAQSGRNAIIEYLIKAGACVTLKGGDGMTALHVAAKTGNMEACSYLLSVPNTNNIYIDTVDDGGWTPLVWATENSHTEVARYLLRKRADPHIRDVEQNIALHWSAFSGCMDITETLINYGSEVNCVNIHGDTSLHVGARQDKYDCVLMLLSRGARVDVVNLVGETPLDCCLKRNNQCYTAIKLNILLGNVVLNVREPTQKILCNDISRGREVNPIQCVNSEDDEEEPSDYAYVINNCVTSNISIDTAITSIQSCQCTDNCLNSRCSCALLSEQCWYDDEGRLIPEFNYADAPMIFECNQCCSCNQVTCNNRVVQHGSTARFQLFRTRRRGWGVRTLTPIPKGTFVCEYIGEIITDCEADNRDDDTYLFDLDNRDGETYCIDARYYGNISRFINHLCVPNLLALRVFVEHQDLHFPRMAFFANRDIEANEELGFDYGEKFWAVKCKAFTCCCGAESCKYSEFTFKTTLNLPSTSRQ